MYPPLPEDARLGELQRQLQPPVAVEDDAAPSRHLPMWLRVGMIAMGALLLVVGLAGLFLPGIQGIVTILAGVAVLSLVSTHADRLLRWSLGPWPRLLERVEHLRERLHDWLHLQAERVRRRWGRRHGCRPSDGS
jgi:hypothetical protein